MGRMPHIAAAIVLTVFLTGGVSPFVPVWPKAYAAPQGDILDAHVRIDVEWNNYNPGKSNIARTGSFFVEVSGTVSRSPDEAPFQFAPKKLTAHYVYQERAFFVRTSDHCPQLYSEHTGSGTARVLAVDSVKDPMKDGHLTITAAPGYAQALRLLKDAQEMKETMESPKAPTKELETDMYTFVLSVPMQVTQTIQSSPCTRYEKSPVPMIAALTSYMNLTKTGMHGSYSWTSRDLDTALQIHDYQGRRTFAPVDNKGDVRYRVTWSFGKMKPMVRIFLITDGDREEITDEETPVLVGQKVKLEAAVVPYGDTGKGSWDIPSPVITGFKADKETGKIIPLDEKQKNRPLVEFFFTNGAFSGMPVTVKYSALVDKGRVEGKTRFNVYEPRATMTVKTSPTVTIGRWEVKDEKGKPRTLLKLYLGELIDYHHTAGRPGIQIDSRIDLPKEFADQQHFLQHVQLVCEDILEYKNGVYYHTGPRQCPGTNEWLLDTHYPYQGMVSEVKLSMDDTPGSQLGLATQELHQFQAFKTFLMFRPSKKADDPKTVWVPLRVVEWRWKASAVRTREYGQSAEPGDFQLKGILLPSQKQCAWTGPPESFPQWESNIAKVKACSMLSEGTWNGILSRQGKGCPAGKLCQ